MRVGPLCVDPPVVLAPMAGVTNPAFRQLCRQFGPALYVSEMITARALVEHNPKTMRMVARAPGEPVHSVQLYGVDPVVMKAAVGVLVDEIGVDHIDMNFGCPAPKVTRRGGGAALPAHPALFRSVVAAAVGAAGSVPVTVKMRTGIDSQVVTAVEAGRIAEGEGAAAVALHARTAEQRYAGPANWDDIARLKEAVTSVPVLGNGDIFEAADALAMMARTGCDGVVVGRGCLGRPWLFADLADTFSHPDEPTSHQPPLGWVADVMLRHARLLVEYLGPGPAMRDFRKHPGWYLIGFPIGPAARSELAQVSSLDELEDRLGRLDPSLTRPPEEARRPRGHTDGPRAVSLPEGWLDDRDDPTPPAGGDEVVSGG
ncbi:MAG TPA: tRNA dihydrouridine synthase DusB [Acidimicrobiales bacterium]|nr:tRNA dihydrouridine synthase DusB [Acidimicrobiales bacterium]